MKHLTASLIFCIVFLCAVTIHAARLAPWTPGEMHGTDVAWVPGIGDAAKGIGRGSLNAAEEIGEAAAKNLDNVGRMAREMPGPVFKTTKEATEAAMANGWKRTNMRTSNQQVIFTDGRNFFSRDATGHKGGAWKLMNPRNPTERIGTLDVNLHLIGE